MKHAEAIVAGLVGVAMLAVGGWLASQPVGAFSLGYWGVSPRPRQVARRAVAAPPAPVPHWLPATSTKKQGDFTFVKAINGEFERYPDGRKTNIAFGPFPAVCTVVWRLPDRPADMPLAHHRAVLTARTGEQETLALTPIPAGEYDASGKDTYAIARITQGYSPHFTDSTIAIYEGDGALGHWNLPPLPRPQRCIGDKEPTVLSGKLGPFAVTASPVRIACTPGPATEIDMRLRFKGKQGSDREYVVMPRFGRTTWSPVLTPNWFTDISVADIEGPRFKPTIPFARDMEKVELFLRLVEYRVLTEEVKVSGLGLRQVTAASAQKPRLEVVAYHEPFEVETPSGVRLALVSAESSISPGDDGGELRLHFRAIQGFQDVHLPKSPLCRSTSRPVRLTFRPKQGGKQPVSVCTTYPDNVDIIVKLSREQIRLGPLPAIPLTVKQKVAVGFSDARFLGPLRDAAPSPAKSH